MSQLVERREESPGGRASDPNIPGCFQSMAMVRSMNRDQSEDGNACPAPGISLLGRLDGM